VKLVNKDCKIQHYLALLSLKKFIYFLYAKLAFVDARLIRKEPETFLKSTH